MTLTDTGPLVALIDKDDAYHAACTGFVLELPPPRVTPWPCFTEAMHLLNRAGSRPAQEKLWVYVSIGALKIHASSEEQTRMRELMARYGNVPMDLADAALVAAAEVLDARRVFSIDSDFYIYRLADGTSLEVVPGPRRERR